MTDDRKKELQLAADTSHAVAVSLSLGTEIAWRLTDILVAKGILTKPEARATMYALAEGLRRDAHHHREEAPAGFELIQAGSEKATEAVATQLESLGDQIFRP